jgi:transcriptional regulator with XRE-family HTH domain
VQRKNLIGSRIKAARKEAHMTQMALAAKLQLMDIKMDRTGIAKIESGRRPVTDIEIIAIAKILNVSIPQLFEHIETLFNRQVVQ